MITHFLVACRNDFSGLRSNIARAAVTVSSERRVYGLPGRIKVFLESPLSLSS